MNPQDELAELLREHNFDLVRQRKHKIYRNPEGLTFVAASTPSDRRAPQNALATLRRILRHDLADKPTNEAPPVPMIRPQPSIQPKPAAGGAPVIKSAQEWVSDQEWEDWKRLFWRDEKLRAKNERFLSAVGRYVSRVSDLMRRREDVASGPASDAVKSLLRASGYKSKVVLYTFRGFDKGIVVHEAADQPIVWATNGHIGVSAFVYFDAYLQHDPSRPDSLRFDWDGIPVLFERPEKSARRFHLGDPTR